MCDGVVFVMCVVGYRWCGVACVFMMLLYGVFFIVLCFVRYECLWMCVMYVVFMFCLGVCVCLFRVLCVVLFVLPLCV